MPEFRYQPLFELDPHETPWRRLTGDFVAAGSFEGQRILKVDSRALVRLAAEAVRDVSHLFRPGHLAQLAKILDDPEASDNDRFVALEMLKNANVSAGMVLPSCQDTGTAIVDRQEGPARLHRRATTPRRSRAASTRPTRSTNLRYSQIAPLTMYEEKNTGTNLPAQIEIYAEPGDEYELLFVTKGGGSANKTFLFQETHGAARTRTRCCKFLDAKIRTLGTAACPPYHLAVVIGGTSAEMTLKTVKLASAATSTTCRPPATPPAAPSATSTSRRRCTQLTQRMGIGAQFGGKYFCHDVRVIRLPRHGASLPRRHRRLLLRRPPDPRQDHPRRRLPRAARDEPGAYLPEVTEGDLPGRGDRDRPRPADERDPRRRSRATRCKTRLSLTGTLIVARDIAHAKLKERIDRGEGLPQYFKDHMIYYAGPAKTPAGYASGSFGPTTAGPHGLLRRPLHGSTAAAS